MQGGRVKEEGQEEFTSRMVTNLQDRRGVYRVVQRGLQGCQRL